MKILITNDDGVYSIGLNALINTLNKEHELFVIAPDRERSATGHSLTLHKPLSVVKNDTKLTNTQIWHTTGTPTDCIKLALCTLLADTKIDLVITGINHGPNLGSDILYSGTVNAAIEGAIYNIPSIAISLTDGNLENKDFYKPAEFLLAFLKEFPKYNLPSNVVLNINVPSNASPTLSNARIAKLGTRMYKDCYEKRLDPRGRVYYWLSGEPIIEGESPDSDVMLTQEGYISITPILFELTDNKVVESLNKFFN